MNMCKIKGWFNAHFNEFRSQRNEIFRFESCYEFKKKLEQHEQMKSNPM